jgi:2-polyprenyl-6-methoxyphenol hydroxylase-like FAD-dependent oxidoreductase
MSKPLALNVGSGPTGMTMAIELKRAGLDVRIIDKENHPAEHSQALVLQARTLEQFQRYGIAERAVERGRKLTRARFWSDQKEILSFAFDRIPSRYRYLLFLAQSETEKILNGTMEELGARTERGVELVAMTQRDGGVEATLRHADGREEQVAARWMPGCDGARSKVRELTFASYVKQGRIGAVQSAERRATAR